MAFKHYKLNFQGYWLGADATSIPNRSGIYCVYCCAYDSRSDKVSIRNLIYIGESKGVRDRVTDDHEKTAEWLDELEEGEELCFSFASISPAGDRRRAEAAMIYWHKPAVNVEHKYIFDFDRTRVTSSGENSNLSPNFEVE